MPLALVYSRAKLGVNAPLVTVEVHLSNGLPAFHIVGLPETSVKESKDRVRSALLNSRFEFPARRITVNLAPADLPKEGGRFDLPIALGILAASGQLPLEPLANCEFVGELGLSGELRRIDAGLPAAIASAGDGRPLLMPVANASEAALFSDARVLPAPSLLAAVAHLVGQQRIELQPPPASLPAPDYPDLRDVRGQHSAKRALEIAAAGGHNLLFSGPPGTGKTLLASRLPDILPPLTESELLTSAAIQSLAGTSGDGRYSLQRPFRTPHHTASAVALVGGGSQPRPGEISLAHGGVLFLDELAEFPRKVLEVLREPLESGEIAISRAARQIHFPAKFQLVAAMNPCPCGYLGDAERSCRCSPDQIARYRQRLSGPLLDRIDLQIKVPRLPTSLLQQAPDGEPSAVVRERVVQARQRQYARSGKTNAELQVAELEQHCALDKPCRELMSAAAERLTLSARAYHRVIKMARSIADLEGSEAIARSHLQEALAYRQGS